VFAALTASAFYPLPSGISTSARIVPRREVPIYISTPGLLRSLSRLPGQFVSEGDEIARLVNHDVELKYLEAKGRFETQREIVEAIRLSALDTPQAANELPAQESLLEDLAEHLSSRRRQKNALLVRAPATGKLIAAPRQPQQPDSPHRLVSWSGYPTDPQNHGCLVEPGQELMSVATDPNWDAELILGQSEVDQVAIGANVRLALEAMPERRFTGKVTDISRAQWTAEQHAERRDDAEAVRRVQPPCTSYVVRVELDPNDVVSVTGVAATARIEVEPLSFVDRASRSLNSLFRFR
jgi:multidrug efflux pump subunit AcrA (membrane-fusion protein)